ncbi:tetratricopeptide repeat protein, partial [bacterium]|nr:tetratricopeptide repeat protein [bacterium]
MSGARVPPAVAMAAAMACALAGCGGGGTDDAAAPAFAIPDPSEVPVPDLADMEPRVQLILRDAAGRVRAGLSVAAEWGRYAMILDAHELYAEATAAYRVAARQSPDEFRWRYLLARVLELQGADQQQPGTVEAVLEEARERDPGYAPLYVRLGAVYARTGRPEEARAAYERAESLDVTSLPARIGTARALMAAGETDAALAKVERCAIEHPDDWETQMLLARVYTVAGRREEAR